ncbi:MAG: GGDEF domain-containing phosphodiesterase [Ruminococcus sp.]|nr:GGDEF domain-containing phosphodiesterase [Ruminococcus sp.]
MEYYILFEEYLKNLSKLAVPDPMAIRSYISGLCKILRISKVVVFFYDSLKDEATGKGRSTCVFNTGEECVVAISDRLVTEINSVAVCEVSIAKDAEPWSYTERERITLALKTTMTFISRLRLKHVTDKLTFYDPDGFHNLRYFIGHMEKLALEDRLVGKVALHFNLKHFSLVNQQVGRNAGSIAMKGYYNTLNDDLDDESTVCRCGGDNFIMICSRSELDRVLRYLSGAAVIYDRDTGDRVMVSACTGVFIIPEGFELNSPGDIIDKVISASQSARQPQNDDVVYFNEVMVANKERIVHLQQLFPSAIQNEEFLVYYQPKVDIDTGEISGAEALCRWLRDGCIVPPADFIPIFEQNSDVCKLDFYMLEHVCRDIRRWLDEGRHVVPVSVNFSRKHMADVDLQEHIVEIIDKYRIPHSFIEVELTETYTDVEFRDLKKLVSGLQWEGIGTSVDDFGVGYSSLKLLTDIPWDVLKVDRSFLPVDEDNDNSCRAILFTHVVSMAQKLGMECIAEGVETVHQVQVLRENNCRYAQGFLFDKPLPVEKFENKLSERHYSL